MLSSMVIPSSSPLRLTLALHIHLERCSPRRAICGLHHRVDAFDGEHGVQVVERAEGGQIAARCRRARAGCLEAAHQLEQRFGSVAEIPADLSAQRRSSDALRADLGSRHAGPPFAAWGLIGTASAVASIGTRLPVHRVVAAFPGQPIPACSSLQDIVSRISEQPVVAVIAGQPIATRTTAYDIIAAEAEDRVVSGQAMDDIIARGPEDRVAVAVPDNGRRQSVT
jgi:hypothetical protein